MRVSAATRRCGRFYIPPEPAIAGTAVHPAQGPMTPPKIDLGQVYGFSLFMLKAVISGRGCELVELAETNLVR